VKQIVTDGGDKEEEQDYIDVYIFVFVPLAIVTILFLIAGYFMYKRASKSKPRTNSINENIEFTITVKRNKQ
jgi:hypothetical protein